ncbi:MAG: gliding motility-associated ABC transporter permease subunit GldF [Bacteroidetes bacterium]|jgi:ABC-2 type transport system permease protein|nr:gliding motility-associated ABC transporter permease subunit GldF [Bacteroidota bacterium]
MIAIIRKEISNFFSSLTGYIVIIVFLVINGLFLWVFPGEFNIMDSQYAGLEPLFFLSPWVFLFLIPAITMRSFAEEKKSGTLQLILTKPIGELELVLAKYFSNLVLVILALIPTLIYYISVIKLGSPEGNIDHGGTWGSYIGLLFLSGIYVSIGIFASILTDNQVVAFIIAVLITFVIFTGFDSIAEIPALESVSTTISKFGINEHYKSMSRGVIDSRDLVYFICTIAIFITGTQWILKVKKHG